MTIRAKFICNSVTDNGHNKSANLSAVYGKEGENADYSRYTPAGALNITIDQDTKAAEFFKPKQSYWLDFTLAE
jgi:hypothetical protein